jgi:hypothetical protein
MALGTTTLIASGGADAGQITCERVTVLLDNSYPTGGYTGLAAKLTSVSNRTPTILAVIEQGTGYKVAWDYANSKLMVFHCDNDAVADSPMIQVPDGTNLAAVTLTLVVFYK